MGLFGAQGAFAGVDVGSAGVKVVAARPGPPPRVFAAAAVPLAPGAVADGIVVDPGAVAEPLRSAVRRGRAVTAVGVQQAVVRLLRFPRMSERELDGALQWEAEKFIPWTGETCLDRVILPSASGDEMEVLLVAAQRRAVDALVAAFRGAGARLAAVDLEALAAQRALVALGLVPDPDAGVFALVDLGEAATRVVIFSRGVPVVARAISLGGGEFTRAVAAALDAPEVEAEEMKRRWGVTEDSPAFAAVRPLAERLASEIWRSLEFFLLLNSSVDLEKVFLIGGNALQPGMPALLEEYLSRRLAERFGRGAREGVVHPVDPAALLGRAGQEAGIQLDARFVVSLGLALWRGK